MRLYLDDDRERPGFSWFVAHADSLPRPWLCPEARRLHLDGLILVNRQAVPVPSARRSHVGKKARQLEILENLFFGACIFRNSEYTIFHFFRRLR